MLPAGYDTLCRGDQDDTYTTFILTPHGAEFYRLLRIAVSRFGRTGALLRMLDTMECHEPEKFAIWCALTARAERELAELN